MSIWELSTCKWQLKPQEQNAIAHGKCVRWDTSTKVELGKARHVRERGAEKEVPVLRERGWSSCHGSQQKRGILGHNVKTKCYKVQVGCGPKPYGDECAIPLL